MTREEYRQHMRKYSRETMVMSFVVTKHPDFQAMSDAGKDIVQYLLEDMIDPDWHCSHCYSEGFEFPAGWVWDNEKRNWPTDTGIPCPECKGKGSINSWACITLLYEAFGDESPKIEEWMRGRHDAIVKVWRKWGEQAGYLPVAQNEEQPSVLTKLVRGLTSLFQ